jgi:hypothetical protein
MKSTLKLSSPAKQGEIKNIRDGHHLNSKY